MNTKMAITKNELSKYRKKLDELLKRIQYLSSKCLFIDDLIKGTPGELYKKCGKKSCKCYKNEDDRHGPYKIIQVRIGKKQKLIPLKKDNYHQWDLAKHYQYQIDKLKELTMAQQDLEALVKEVIEKRTMEFP